MPHLVRVHPEVCVAYVQHLKESTTGVAPLLTICCAFNFACEVNGVRRIMNDFAVAVIKEKTRSERDTRVLSVFELTADEAQPVLDQWGWRRDRCAWRRQIALFMNLSVARAAGPLHVLRLAAPALQRHHLLPGRLLVLRPTTQDGADGRLPMVSAGGQQAVQ